VLLVAVGKGVVVLTQCLQLLLQLAVEVAVALTLLDSLEALAAALVITTLQVLQEVLVL
jgi:hypothetical protein